MTTLCDTCLRPQSTHTAEEAEGCANYDRFMCEACQEHPPLPGRTICAPCDEMLGLSPQCEWDGDKLVMRAPAG